MVVEMKPLYHYMTKEHSNNNNNNNNNDRNVLLTQKTLALSLSAPRCPPYHTRQRYMLVNGGKGKQHHRKDDVDKEASSSFHHHHHHHMRFSLPHPHLMSVSPDSTHYTTRFLSTVLPLEWQHKFRDDGWFRYVADTVVETSIPVAAMGNPKAAIQFVQLTKICQHIQYGPLNEQYMDVFLPSPPTTIKKTTTTSKKQSSSSTTTSLQYQNKGMIFFIHGGAWGSGKPWFYRLIATKFLQMGVAVTIVGYRVYPIAKTVKEQIVDLEAALTKLTQLYPEWCIQSSDDSNNDQKTNIQHLGTIIMGHSSGAHIALLWMVERAKQQLMKQQKQQEKQPHNNNNIIQTMIGLCGPYNIDHHYDYEASRGVEEISPLKPINGFSRISFQWNTPQYRLRHMLRDIIDESESPVCEYFPSRILLLHGIEDETVPFTNTSETAHTLKSCGLTGSVDEIYVEKVGHQDTVVQLMLGGVVQTTILNWLFKDKKQEPSDMLLLSNL